MKYQSSRAARSAATAIALTAAAGAVTVSHSADAQSQPPTVQWRVQDGGNGHWYQLRVESRTWNEHRALALSSGAHLATITSAGEGAFVSANLPGRAWLGAVASANQGCNTGAWQWITGEQWTYSNWAPTEPNYCDETHLELSGTFPGKWNNYYPWIPGRALVEWSADCNGDGIVDFGQCRDGSLPDYNGNNIPDCCESGSQCLVDYYPVQWRVQDGGNGHWYGFGAIVAPDRPWMEMRSAAEAMGGHLLTISSAAEDQFAFRFWRVSQPFRGRDMMAGPLGYFVMPGGQWQSVTGEPITYSNWRPATSSPPLPPAPDNGNSVHRFATWLNPSWGSLAGTWEDWLDSELGNPADPLSPFLVEWDADCNGDGIVDYGQILRGQLADVNGDGIPNVCQCPGDVTANNTVDGVDLAALLSAWGTNGQGQFMTDIDGDGIVSGADLAYVLSGWGPCPD